MTRRGFGDDPDEAALSKQGSKRVVNNTADRWFTWILPAQSDIKTQNSTDAKRKSHVSSQPSPVVEQCWPNATPALYTRMSICEPSRMKASAKAETDANLERSTRASSAFLKPVACCTANKGVRDQKRSVVVHQSLTLNRGLPFLLAAAGKD